MGQHKLPFWKKALFCVLPLLILVGLLETGQRVRYAIRYDNWGWLLYGFPRQQEQTDPGRPVDDRGPAQRAIRASDPADLAKALRNRAQASGDAVEEAEPENPADARPGDLDASQPATDRRPRRYIVCIGGSSTAGVFNDAAHTYPALLRDLLWQHGLDTFEVVNAGMSGGTSDDYVLYDIIQAVLDVRPEVVILYTGYNDIFTKDVNKLYAAFNARISSVYAAAERYSLLLVTAKEKYLFTTMNAARTRELSAAELQRLAELEAEFEHNIRDYARQLVAQGVRVVLIPEVLIARDFGGPTVNYESYARRYTRIPGILRRIAESEGAEALDLQQEFDRPDFQRYFIDPVHLTNEGNIRLSRLIIEKSKTLQALLDGRTAGASRSEAHD